MAGMLKTQKLMVDDNNKKCAFNTSSHDPNHEKYLEIGENDIIPLPVNNPSEDLNNNK